MQIFTDPQGQLTPQSRMVLLEISSEILYVLVTCKNEEDPIKTVGLEWSHNTPSIFKMFKGT